MIRGFAVVVLLALGATSGCAARSEPTTLVGELMEDVVDTLEMERYRSRHSGVPRMATGWLVS